MKRKITTLLVLGTGEVLALSASVASATHGSGDPVASARQGSARADSSALSSAGSGDVQQNGSCSSGSRWKLKAKQRNGRIEIEFEVDQNRSGVLWGYAIRRNGKRVAKGTRTTRGRSGSFTVERRIADPAGTDTIAAVATRRGETCRGSLKI